MVSRDGTTGDGPTDRTRRQWLLAVGAGATAGLAGCSSESGDSGEDDDDEDDGGNGSTESPGAGEQSADSEQQSDNETGDCPSSFNYVTQEYSAFEVNYTVGQCEVPEIASIQSTGNGFQARHDWTRREIATFGVTCFFNEDSDREGAEPQTVGGTVEAIMNSSSYEVSRATDQYETATDSAVVLVSDETVLGEYEIPSQTSVVMDHPNGVAEINITPPLSTICNGASARIHRRLVESQRPA